MDQSIAALATHGHPPRTPSSYLPMPDAHQNTINRFHKALDVYLSYTRHAKKSKGGRHACHDSNLTAFKDKYCNGA
eukprot:1158359-Pelagomonas_calceolata.AAC.6